MTKRILIAGATGRTGRIVVNKLLSQGITPQVLVRDLAKANNLFGRSVIYHQGDVREICSLCSAMKDVEMVVSCIGSRTPVGKNCPRRVDFEGVANLVYAAGTRNVKRFIHVSSISVTHSEHPLNAFGKVLDWKLKGEEILRASNLSYAIIRPGKLLDTPGRRYDLTIAQGDHIVGMISRDDLATIILHMLFFPKKLRVTFGVIEAEQKNKIGWIEQFPTLSPD